MIMININIGVINVQFNMVCVNDDFNIVMICFLIGFCVNVVKDDVVGMVIGEKMIVQVMGLN